MYSVTSASRAVISIRRAPSRANESSDGRTFPRPSAPPLPPPQQPTPSWAHRQPRGCLPSCCRVPSAWVVSPSPRPCLPASIALFTPKGTPPASRRDRRVARGGFPPRAPTDPYVQDYRIRLLGSCTRCLGAVHRVNDSGRRKRVSRKQPRKSLPAHTAARRPPTQPLSPDATDLVSIALQGATVPRDAVVGVMAKQLTPKRTMLLRNREVTMVPTPALDSPEGTAQPCCGRLALDDRVPGPGAAPVVREAQEIERGTATLTRAGRGSWNPKRYETSLLRMEHEPVLRKPFSAVRSRLAVRRPPSQRRGPHRPRSGPSGPAPAGVDAPRPGTTRRAPREGTRSRAAAKSRRPVVSQRRGRSACHPPAHQPVATSQSDRVARRLAPADEVSPAAVDGRATRRSLRCRVPAPNHLASASGPPRVPAAPDGPTARDGNHTSSPRSPVRKPPR